MMVAKTLFIARHAKSSWKDASLRDSQRPLNKRGMRDAPVMANRLAMQSDHPQVIFSSPAVRAVRTAEIFTEFLSLNEDALKLDERIYTADASDLLEIVREFDNQFQRAMLVGHNPALTDLLNLLTDEQIENMPTCSIATVSFDKQTWQQVCAGGGRLVEFDFPKK